jgi:hypothetical protein
MARPTLGEKAMSVAERTRSSRTARQQSGKRIDVMLGPDASTALEELRQSGEYGENTKDIVEAALIKEAKRTSSRRKKEDL